MHLERMCWDKYPLLLFHVLLGRVKKMLIGKSVQAKKYENSLF